MSDKKRANTNYQNCDGCVYLHAHRESMFSPTEPDERVKSFHCLHDRGCGFLGFVAIVEPDECPLE